LDLISAPQQSQSTPGSAKMRFAALSAAVTVAVQVVHGKVYDSLDSLPRNRKYDFIVVGGQFTVLPVNTLALTPIFFTFVRWKCRVCSSQQAHRKLSLHCSTDRSWSQVSPPFSMCYITPTQLARARSNEGVFDLQVPGLTNSINATYQWPYVTEPQVHVNNRSLAIPRGHVLGGSSSISALYCLTVVSERSGTDAFSQMA
jgi:hypothetical protein